MESFIENDTFNNLPFFNSSVLGFESKGFLNSIDSQTYENIVLGGGAVEEGGGEEPNPSPAAHQQAEAHSVPGAGNQLHADQDGGWSREPRWD